MRNANDVPIGGRVAATDSIVPRYGAVVAVNLSDNTVLVVWDDMHNEYAQWVDAMTLETYKEGE